MTTKPVPPRPAPRLMLFTPPLSGETAGPRLAEALPAADIAAVVVSLQDGSERDHINTVKALIAPIQQAGAAVLLSRQPGLVARTGADGAHLWGADAFHDNLATLKPDRIAGAGGLATRHDAMAVAEAGADYVMFGEPDETGHRPAADSVLERIGWWAEVFEAPCVGYAGTIEEIAPLVAAGADFVALDPALWWDKPAVSLRMAMAALALPETVA